MQIDVVLVFFGQIHAPCRDAVPRREPPRAGTDRPGDFPEISSMSLTRARPAHTPVVSTLRPFALALLLLAASAATSALSMPAPPALLPGHDALDILPR